MRRSDPKGVVVIKVHRVTKDLISVLDFHDLEPHPQSSSIYRAANQRDSAIKQKIIPKDPGYGVIVNDYQGKITLARFTSKGMMRRPKDGIRPVRRFWQSAISPDELTDRIMDTIGNDIKSSK
jgi:hypothetical protein